MTDAHKIREEAKCLHWYVFGFDRRFVIYNDDGSLSMDPIEEADIVPIAVYDGGFLVDAAWSSDVEWYFVVTKDGIALCRVGFDLGMFCKKRSARFIEKFLDAPRPQRTRRALASVPPKEE